MQDPLMPRGLVVRLVALDQPPFAYAFLFDSFLNHTLLAVLAGTVELVFKNRCYVAEVAEIHYLDEDCLVRGIKDTRSRFYLLRFSEEYAAKTIYKVLQQATHGLLTRDSYPIAEAGSGFKIIKRLLELLCKHQDSNTSPNSGTINELTFNLLLSCLAEHQQFKVADGPQRLRRKEIIAIRYFRLIERDYKHNHDVLHYAQELYMSQGNLAKVIREVTGKAPKALLDERLISIIKSLLDTTGHTIYILAEETGFKSASAFNNFFKGHTRMTPNEYRNRKKR